jgi:hypothetical protein
MSDTEDSDLSEVDIIVLSDELFQIDVDSTVQVEKTFVKWTCDHITYGLPVPLLTTTRVASIIEHCLQVLHMIDGRVGVTSWNRFVSYTMVLPMTFSDALRAVWYVVTADHPYPTLDVLGFHATLQCFFAEFADSEDRYELLQLLLISRKPPTMSVTAYYSRLHTLNEFVAWLPGATPALTPDKLRQVFHDGMPQRWRICYRMTGRSVRHDSTAAVKEFFRKQEYFANKTLLVTRQSIVDDRACKFIAFCSLNLSFPHHLDLFTLSQESSRCSHTPDEIETLYV